MDLPKALDDVLKALLSGHSISSWKVVADGQNPTIVLRLCPKRVPNVCQDGVRVDTTTAYRRKPPSQINRDKRRMNDFIHRNDRVEKQSVHVSESACRPTLPVKDNGLNICEIGCVMSAIESTVDTKDSDRESRVVDTESRSLDSVARAEDTGVTLEENTHGEASAAAADASSEAATLPTCTASPAGVTVSDVDTVKNEVKTTTTDPIAVEGAHGERREERVQDSEGCTGGQGVVKKVSLEKGSDSASGWVDVSGWVDSSGSRRKRELEKGIADIIVRRSKREGRDVKKKDLNL